MSKVQSFAAGRALGTELRALLERMDGDVARTLLDLGLHDYRPRFSPIIRALIENGPSSVRELAITTGVTHSAASQTVAAMTRAGYVEAAVGTADARQRVVHLSAKARRDLPAIRAEWAATTAAVDALNAELTVPIGTLIDEITAALARRTLHARIADRLTPRTGAVRAMSLLLDVRPLTVSPAFRRLVICSLLSQIGGQMTSFAVALQVWQLTGSSLAVGGIGLAAAIPAVIVGTVGGPLIDRVDRRRLVLVTSSCLAAVSVLFAVQSLVELDNLVVLYGLIALQYAVGAINGPARRTFMPRLLPTSLIPAGAALLMLTMHIGVVAGPPLAGLIAGTAGLKTCYALDAVSFLAALYAVFRLPPMVPEGRAAAGLAGLLEGLRFIVYRKVLLGALLSDLAATVLAFPFALFPQVNAERFGGSAVTLGLLSAAVAVGGVLGSTFSGPVSRVTHHGRAMLMAVCGWGLALIGFGLVSGLAWTLTFLVLAGIADVTSVVYRTTIVQTVTPDRLRGRVSAAEYVIGATAPELGNFRSGAVASVTGTTFSAVLGGLSTLLAAGLLAVFCPALRRETGEVDVAMQAEAIGSGN